MAIDPVTGEEIVETPEIPEGGTTTEPEVTPADQLGTPQVSLPALDEQSEKAAVLLAERDWVRLAGMGDAAAEILIPILQKGEIENRLRAVETLGRIGDAGAVDPLAALLGDRRPEIASAAAQALGYIGSGLAVEPLLQIAVESESSRIRTECEKALIKIGAAAVRPLLERLNSSEPRERKAAVRILGEIGDERALQFLISARDDTSLQPELQATLEKLGWHSEENGKG